MPLDLTDEEREALIRYLRDGAGPLSAVATAGADKGDPSEVGAGGRIASAAGRAQGDRATAGPAQTVAVVKSHSGPPMTLGNAAEAKVRLIVWCTSCGHQAEPDVAAAAEAHGADLPVPEWRARLRCSRCDGRDVDFVVSGARR